MTTLTNLTSPTAAFSRALRDLLWNASQRAQSAFYSREFSVYYKQGERSPYTSADLAVNNILKEQLSSLLPAACWLSEEDVDDSRRLEHDEVWIVDPIDGTSAFIKGDPQFAISVALARRGRPAGGGVALPIDQLIVVAAAGQTMAWRYRSPDSSQAEQGRWERLSGGLSTCDCLEDARILVSPTDWKRGYFEPISRELHCIPEGSIARKLALVAIGEGDLTVSVSPKHEWDIAGGAALILNQERGAMTDLLSLQPHSFNNKNTVSYGLVAGPRPLVEQFQSFWRKKGWQDYCNFC